MAKNEKHKKINVGATKAVPFNLSELDPAEQTLLKEVKELIDTEEKHAKALKLTRAEQKTRRLALGQKLFHLKGSLSKPGRGSSWGGFLREAGIHIRNADRWVEAYGKTLKSEQNSDIVQVPVTLETIRTEANRLLPRLRRLGFTDENLHSFVDVLVTDWLKPS